MSFLFGQQQAQPQNMGPINSANMAAAEQELEMVTDLFNRHQRVSLFTVVGSWTRVMSSALTSTRTVN
jgi:hypothetical protein